MRIHVDVNRICATKGMSGTKRVDFSMRWHLSGWGGMNRALHANKVINFSEPMCFFFCFFLIGIG